VGPDYYGVLQDTRDHVPALARAWWRKIYVAMGLCIILVLIFTR